MNKKRIAIITLVLILIVSVASVLVINGYPDLTADWSDQLTYVRKQYIKVVGFISVMGLVYIAVEGMKTTKLEEQDEENKIEE
jgi:agmatine/peptidylarginine deiminase